MSLPSLSASDLSNADMDIEAFLRDVERKAYRIALFALGEHADALDVLQDSMFKLVTNYAQKPSNEWKPLFYRILHNRITDIHRQRKIRRVLTFWRSDDQDDGQDIEHVSDPNARQQDIPTQALEQQQQQTDVLAALEGLPDKQQQCFLLRSWEGLSVADTALAMGCSQGSVKTHYSRAVNKLRTLLGDKHDISI